MSFRLTITEIFGEPYWVGQVEDGPIWVCGKFSHFSRLGALEQLKLLDEAAKKAYCAVEDGGNE